MRTNMCEFTLCYIHVCLHIHVYADTHRERERERDRERERETKIYIYICMHACIHTCTACMPAYICFAHVCTRTQVHTDVYINGCVYRSCNTNRQKFVYMYVYIFLHTHIHIYIYMVAPPIDPYFWASATYSGRIPSISTPGGGTP